jgi:hypothetical protein
LSNAAAFSITNDKTVKNCHPNLVQLSLNQNVGTQHPHPPTKKIPVANESTIATCPFGAESLQAFGKKNNF